MGRFGYYLITVLKTIKNFLLTKVFYLLRKRNTRIGKIIWVLNGTLFLFFLHFVVYVLLEPFGFLNQFVLAVVLITDFFVAIILHYIEKNFFSFLDERTILEHIVLSLSLLIAYYLSGKHIWKNKENYIN